MIQLPAAGRKAKRAQVWVRRGEVYLFFVLLLAKREGARMPAPGCIARFALKKGGGCENSGLFGPFGRGKSERNRLGEGWMELNSCVVKKAQYGVSKRAPGVT